MHRNTESRPVRPITDLMREQDLELERMVVCDQRWLTLLAASVAGLCVTGAALWLT